jgi:hypothetical protein
MISCDTFLPLSCAFCFMIDCRHIVLLLTRNGKLAFYDYYCIDLGRTLCMGKKADGLFRVGNGAVSRWGSLVFVFSFSSRVMIVSYSVIMHASSLLLFIWYLGWPTPALPHKNNIYNSFKKRPSPTMRLIA